MDEITAVEILRKVLTGNQKNKVPLNSAQEATQKHNASIKANPVVAEPPQTARAPALDPQPNYVSDSKDEEDAEDDDATVKRFNCSHSLRTARDNDLDADSNSEPHPGIRGSKRILQQTRDNAKEGLHRITAPAAK